MCAGRSVEISKTLKSMSRLRAYEFLIVEKAVCTGRKECLNVGEYRLHPDHFLKLLAQMKKDGSPV